LDEANHGEKKEKKRSRGRGEKHTLGKETYIVFSSNAGVAGPGESTIIVSISSVQTTISGAMSSEACVESCWTDFGAASGSDKVLAGGDKGLAELASEVRVERRESKSLPRRPFPEPLDCRVRECGEFPIISVETTDHWLGGSGFRDIWRRAGRRC
jgi:hypothetical protein